MNTKAEKVEAFSRLLDVLDMLRTHCPWDMKQTNASLRGNSIEEVYELSEALLKDEVDEIKKELGDVLLHILFYARIADEKEQFDIADVCNALCNKLIYRHPHIYGTARVDTAEQVTAQWEKVKQVEKGGNKTLLSGVPSTLPSLIKAFRITEKAAAVGFDWKKKEDVWEKVAEEHAETMEAVNNNKAEQMEEEFGDLIFSIVNAARLYGVNPDNALEKTNKKFIRRIAYIETKAKESGRKLTDMSLEEMDILWNEAKKMKDNT